MTTDIKFSVTVPAYKAQFLAECIDSILAQTYKNFELIIVNDASPQDLDSIVSKYDDPRIRYYKNKVGFGAEHVVGNWNKCLEYATGDYIICMGDDDKLLPNCLEEYVKLIEKYPGLGLYHGWSEEINEHSTVTKIYTPLPEIEGVYSLIYASIWGRQQMIGDFLFDIKILRKDGGFYDLPYAWSSDKISSYIGAAHAGVASTRTPVFQFRVSSLSISGSAHNKEKMEAAYTWVIWLKSFLMKEPATCDKTELLIREMALKNLPVILHNNVKYYMWLDFRTTLRFKSFIYWLKKRSKYNIDIHLIIRMLLKSLG